MMLAHIDQTVQELGSLLWGWPLIGFIAITGIAFSIVLRGIQFRYFTTAIRYVLTPEAGTAADRISPLQAFMNTLSGSVGNGSLVGMATAIYAGGPGAAFWVFILGFISMPIRFAEVYAGTSTTLKLRDNSLRGGPVAYISQAPGGWFLAPLYVFFCFLMTLASGCAMQCQSITGGLVNVTGGSPYLFAGLLFGLLLYIMSGGAQRVLKFSDMIVPVKVILFFAATSIALIYHIGSLPEALRTILKYAFTIKAVSGGLIGHTMQGAIRFGFARVLNATEVGLGTAGILYGATGSQHPVRSGIMAMLTTFISNHLVCTTLMLLMVMAGTWNSGVNGIDLTVLTYSTVFGKMGAIVVTTLSAMFGLGVLVTYAYIGRECWNFLTTGRYFGLYALIYCLCALIGSLAQLSIVWNAIDICNAFLIAINLYALWMALPRMRIAVAQHEG